MLRKLDAKRSSEGAGTKAQLGHPFSAPMATRSTRPAKECCS